MPEGQENPPISQPVPSNNPAQLSLPYMEVESPPTSTQTHHCNRCGKELDTEFHALYDKIDDIYYCTDCAEECVSCQRIDNIDRMHQHDRYWYCDDCFQHNFVSCPNCQEIVPKDEFLAPNRRNSYSMKKGGCTECSFRCDSCDRVVDKENGLSYEDEEFCEDCYGEHFTTCESCSDTIPQDDSIYVDNVGSFCSSCYEDRFVACNGCHETIEKDEAHEFEGDLYCEDCYAEKEEESLKPFQPLIDNFAGFSWSKKDRLIDKLFKLLPISVKELKAKHSALASGLNDLISFAKGKTITPEIVQNWRESLGVEEFPVEYGTWTELQRSIETLPEMPFKTPQLVVKIIASSQMLSELQANPALYDLFDKVNTVSLKSTHPYSKNQIGWARLELDPNKNFILVDEIQCDHQNAAYRFEKERSAEINQIRSELKRKYNLDEDGFNQLIKEYRDVVKDFADVATAAVSQFARKNGYSKLYWHTYESGKKLKDNSPPRSLYEKVPKENFFLPTEERPFGLEGQFLSREAAIKKLLRIARGMRLKHNF